MYEKLSPIEILKEACYCDTVDYLNNEEDYEDNDDYLEDLDNVEDDMDEIDDYEDEDENGYPIDEDDLTYEAEMVVVHQNGSNYVIEMSDLYPYIKKNNLSIEEAFKNVCEHNNLDFKDVKLLIESKNTIISALREAKEDCDNCKNKDIKLKKRKYISMSIQNISALKSFKNKGIKVVKKK